MEIEKFKGGSGRTQSEADHENHLIQVRAIINCPRCGYNKTFKNQFHRNELESLVVSFKVFDWMACPKENCGELLKLDAEFQI
jgi:hypothetical protein